MNDRELYERADAIFDCLWPLFLLAFFAFMVFVIGRAWLHYDAWKWMVQQ